MSTSTSHVLRVGRIDDEAGAFVLVNVEQSQTGTAALDLRLIGTDGSSPFVGLIQQSGISKLQGKKPQCTPKEWETLLKAVLLHDLESLQSETYSDIETVATVDNSINVIVRRKIGDITSRLGSIQLQQDDDVEIGLFDWAAQAASSSDDLRSQLIDLQTSVQRQKDQLTKLNAQLDDLIKAKKEHEDQLIAKFAQLLNTKKLKIRDQQRLLSHAIVDPATAKLVGSARGTNHAVGQSRPGKRKANESHKVESESDMEVTGRREDEDDEAETSEGSNRDATEDEDSDAEGFAPAPAASQASKAGGGRKGEASATAPALNQDDPMTNSKEAALPPKRNLPFAKKPTEQPAPPTRSGDAVTSQKAESLKDDDETDDEL